MDRKQRISIFRENLELFANGFYLTPSGGKVDLTPARVYWYDEPFDAGVERTVPGGTIFEVRNEDCIEALIRLDAEGYNAAILNMASASHPGGGVENGSGAQEEQLCRRSNLVMSLYQFQREKVMQYPELGLPVREEQYPLHPRYGGIYSDCVMFFREDEQHDCGLSERPFLAGVISVAGISHPTLDENGLMSAEDEDRTKDKIRTILRIGLAHDNDALVLGALGCGAFANPPAQIARLFHEIFLEEEFKDKYRKVTFAILEDHNSLRNGKGGNFRPFRNEFKQRIVL